MSKPNVAIEVWLPFAFDLSKCLVGTLGSVGWRSVKAMRRSSQHRIMTRAMAPIWRVNRMDITIAEMVCESMASVRHSVIDRRVEKP